MYRATIGLEIHAELATETKMFCACKNDPNESQSNVHVCPVCMAHPGTLPVPNRQAVEHVLRVGKALGATLADFSEFDRKSYFYPDIPKGYQISQYEYPLVAGGELAGVAITRVHLEEDTARSSHGASATSEGNDRSLVDFNRAGVPLMELVTEPVIHDAKTAGNFARELQALLRALGASHANLEKGEMRIEANISISKDDTFGTKVEVKNLNSFRSVERAIEYEIARQAAVLEAGEKVIQETRGWNETTQQTFHQRVKEGSADYRYFPEPDIPKIFRSEIPTWSDESLTASLPELPAAKRERYGASGLSTDDATFLAFDSEWAAFFDATCTELEAQHIKIAANYLVSDVRGTAMSESLEGFGRVTPTLFAQLVRMVASDEVSSRGAKDVLRHLMLHGGESAHAVATNLGVLQVHDDEALKGIVDVVMAENPAVVQEFKSGKESVLQFLIGQCMKASKGAGNPKSFDRLLREALV